MQDSNDSYIEPKSEIDITSNSNISKEYIPKNTDTVVTEAPNVSQDEYKNEVKKMINVDEKNWNIHMLRVCTKCLTDMSKQDFKKKRWVATISNNFKLEKKILEQMLCDKVSTLSFEEFSIFYKRLSEFNAKRHLHPRRKYIDY